MKIELEKSVRDLLLKHKNLSFIPCALYLKARCGVNMCSPRSGEVEGSGPLGRLASSFNYLANTKPMAEPVKTK